MGLFLSTTQVAFIFCQATNRLSNLSMPFGLTRHSTLSKNLDFCAIHDVSTRSFKKPPGARPIEVSFRPGGAGRSDAAGDVR